LLKTIFVRVREHLSGGYRKTTGLYPSLTIDTAGTGVVSHAGAVRRDGTLIAMTRSFVPEVEDPEHVWQATRTFAIETTGWSVTERRMFALEYVHNGWRYRAEVGQRESRTRDGVNGRHALESTGEPVLAILEAPESRCYLVCTPNRGVLRGAPILVGFNEVTRATGFDGRPEATT
jgi:hypothetical protein